MKPRPISWPTLQLSDERGELLYCSSGGPCAVSFQETDLESSRTKHEK